MNMRSVVGGVLLSCVLGVSARAQCAVPDGLDGGSACFQFANANVPQRAFQQQALGICWLDCGIDATANYVARWGALNPVMGGTPPLPSCSWYRTRLRLYSGSTLVWNGQMQLMYARTWSEVNSSGIAIQVWRFLVNGDMRPVSSSAGPCAIPPCAAPNGNRVRFTGYVDYARTCNTSGPGPVAHAWMLTHACDAIDHAPGFPRAGAYHPNRNYTFVGPAASFVPGLGVFQEIGASTSESMRHLDVPILPVRCLAEESMVTVSFNQTNQYCLCGTGAPTWFEGAESGFAAGGSSFFNVASGDPFRSVPIGAWTNPTAYPGFEEVRWNVSELVYVECTGVSRQDQYFGVTTAGGFQPFSIVGGVPPMPLSDRFIDQSNSALFPAGTSIRNVPYRSDRVLNLNL